MLFDFLHWVILEAEDSVGNVDGFSTLNESHPDHAFDFYDALACLRGVSEEFDYEFVSGVPDFEVLRAEPVVDEAVNPTVVGLILQSNEDAVNVGTEIGFEVLTGGDIRQDIEGIAWKLVV